MGGGAGSPGDLAWMWEQESETAQINTSDTRTHRSLWSQALLLCVACVQANGVDVVWQFDIDGHVVYLNKKTLHDVITCFGGKNIGVSTQLCWKISRRYKIKYYCSF